MKRTLLIIAMATSLLLAACTPQAPVVATPQPTAGPTAEPSVEPAAPPTAEAAAGEQAATPAPDQATASASPSLTSNPWQWVGFTSPVEQFKLDQPENYLLTFLDDGTVEVKADCNNASGAYAADDTSLAIKLGPMTAAACPSESRSDQFIKVLSNAANYFFADGKLYIDLMADGGTLRLDPAGETASAAAASAAEQVAAEMAQNMVAALTANPWKWTAYATGSEQVTVETPASYMLTFRDDGTVEIKADCNNAAGTYTLDGTNITIEVGPSTLAACPSDSRSEQFIQLVGDAVSFFALGDKLYVALKNEGSTMAFDAVITTVVDLCGEKALAINEIEDTLAPEISAKLDQGLVTFLQAGKRSAPGVSMLVITPQGRYFKSTGVADVTACEPLPADSQYQIGSNTKMMTSAIIFQLQEEGVLSTSDPLSQWLPDLAALFPYGDKITIDMLLTHTSGLFDYLDDQVEGTVADGAKDKAMLVRDFTPEELVKFAADNGQPYFEPGSEGQFHYTNTGYILLGLIIEKATGKSYEENLQTRIFEPLGLKQTYLQTGQPEPGALPQGYLQPPFDYTTGEWNASQAWSAGAVVSTPDEFATFLKALFTGKLYKQPETLKLMQKYNSAGAAGLGGGVIYGHGMSNNNGVLGHGGQTLGFQSDGGYIPDKDVTFVMWSNSAENNVNRTAVPDLANIVFGVGTATTTGENMKSSGQAEPAAGKPEYVTALEAAYGAPSQAAFGSAVFTEQLKASDELDQAALAKYKFFTGDLWERWAEEAWMGPWKEVYARKPGAAPNIVAELRGISDTDAKISVPMILDNIEGAEAARAALSAAYDDPAVSELRVFNLGDSGAMSGLLVAGRRRATGEATFLVFLMD